MVEYYPATVEIGVRFPDDAVVIGASSAIAVVPSQPPDLSSDLPQRSSAGAFVRPAALESPVPAVSQDDADGSNRQQKMPPDQSQSAVAVPRLILAGAFRLVAGAFLLIGGLKGTTAVSSLIPVDQNEMQCSLINASITFRMLL